MFLSSQRVSDDSQASEHQGLSERGDLQPASHLDEQIFSPPYHSNSSHVEESGGEAGPPLAEVYSSEEIKEKMAVLANKIIDKMSVLGKMPDKHSELRDSMLQELKAYKDVMKAREVALNDRKQSLREQFRGFETVCAPN
ncbi:hypothetical protein HKX48_003472 [Thoreauomyces humboldtii]|nr:hypothetical protein HKX48_003472 [Thoreauomyces humboldtii]